MNKFDVKVHFPGVKVTMIKTLRYATGMGLKEAKDAVELTGRDYVVFRMTGDQAALLMAHVTEERERKVAINPMDSLWRFEVESIKRLKVEDVVDVSGGLVGTRV